MAAALAASILDAVLGLAVASTGQEAGNHVSLQGLTCGARHDGSLEIGIARCEVASLRLASGPFVLEVGRVALHTLLGQVRVDAGRPRLWSLEASNVEVSGVKLQGPLAFARQAASSAWCLGPLAAANGTIRAEIVDAHLLFDADVTVPIREGQIDFGDATVEHVGPDSRMGVSRLGVYVDAPNGRSYLYQFPSAPVAGVDYERRGTLLGPWVSSRGSLRLQAFGESLLRQTGSGLFLGFTDQARLLFDRTALSGDLQLSDGRFAAPGLQADLVGHADGRNAVRLHSEAVGRGLTIDMASLSVRNAALDSNDTQLACDEIAGALLVRSFVEDAQLRFAFDLEHAKISGLRLHRAKASEMR